MTSVHSDGDLEIASLFSGIGGLDSGLVRSHAGRVTSYCESWHSARTVLTANDPSPKCRQDVRRIRGFLGAGLVTAGFPCTDLSQAGATRGLDGVSSRLILDVLSLVAVHKPAWLLLENVPNMLRLGSGEAMQRIVTDLEDAGYDWAYRVVDSRFTGLAQRRRRVLLLASLDDDPTSLLLGEDAGAPKMPSAAGTYGFSWTEGNRGLGWAVGAVPTLKGGTTMSVPSPPAVWIPSAEVGLQMVRPSIEATEVLQGFDAGWTAPAPERDRWKLVGNAVSTRVAEWIGERLATRADIQDVVADDSPLYGARWPNAARGSGGKRWSVDVSEWPRSPSAAEQQDLGQVLRQHGSVPLSHRATKGFRDRLLRSALRYPDAFGRDLDAHVEATAC